VAWAVGLLTELRDAAAWPPELLASEHGEEVWSQPPLPPPPLQPAAAGSVSLSGAVAACATAPGSQSEPGGVQRRTGSAHLPAALWLGVSVGAPVPPPPLQPPLSPPLAQPVSPSLTQLRLSPPLSPLLPPPPPPVQRSPSGLRAALAQRARSFLRGGADSAGSCAASSGLPNADSDGDGGGESSAAAAASSPHIGLALRPASAQSHGLLRDLSLRRARPAGEPASAGERGPADAPRAWAGPMQAQPSVPDGGGGGGSGPRTPHVPSSWADAAPPLPSPLPPVGSPLGLGLLEEIEEEEGAAGARARAPPPPPPPPLLTSFEQSRAAGATSPAAQTAPGTAPAGPNADSPVAAEHDRAPAPLRAFASLRARSSHSSHSNALARARAPPDPPPREPDAVRLSPALPPLADGVATLADSPCGGGSDRTADAAESPGFPFASVARRLRTSFSGVSRHFQPADRPSAKRTSATFAGAAAAVLGAGEAGAPGLGKGRAQSVSTAGFVGQPPPLEPSAPEPAPPQLLLRGLRLRCAAVEGSFVQVGRLAAVPLRLAAHTRSALLRHSQYGITSPPRSIPAQRRDGLRCAHLHGPLPTRPWFAPSETGLAAVSWRAG
jgi:hypothetical protein